MTFEILEHMETQEPYVQRIAASHGLQVMARLIAYYGVRNSELESLHVDHISDPEMRTLMLDIEKNIGRYLARLVLEGVMEFPPGEFSGAQLGDWHHILANGPSYDRNEYFHPTTDP